MMPSRVPGAAFEPWFDVTTYRSLLHVHDRRCLLDRGVMVPTMGENNPPPVPGDATWVACSVNGTVYHLHGEARVAHFMSDRICKFPGNAPASQPRVAGEETP